MKLARLMGLTVLVVMMMVTLTATTQATTYTWTHGGGDTNWTTTANWSGGTYPGSADTANLTNTGVGTVSVNGAQTVDTVSLQNSSGNYTLSGNTLTINTKIEQTAAATNTVSSALAGSGTLSVLAGTLNLTATSTIGSLNLGGATLSFSGSTLTLTGATAITASGTNSLTGGSSLAWSGDKIINVTSGTTTSAWYMSGGSGMSITVSGAGTFTNTNTWSLGNMTADGGNYNYQGSSTSGQTITTLTAKNGGTWTTSGGVVNGDITITNPLSLNGGTISGQRKLSIQGGAASNMVVSDGTSTLSASVWLQNQTRNIVVNSGTLTLSSTHIENNQSITKTGTGTLVLSGTLDTAWGGGTLLASAGTTFLNGSLNRGVTASSGATVGGSGTVTNTVSIPTGAHLAPGANAVGHLTANVLTLGNSAICDFEFNATPANDYVAVSTSGGLTIGTGETVNLYAEGTTNQWTGTGTYTLFTYSGTLNGSASNLSVGNPIGGQTYTFASNGSQVTLTITAGSGAPNAPSNLTATTISNTQINLAWTDNSSNETGFKIERKTGSAGTYAQIGTVGADVTAYNDTGLTPATQYYYQVRATNGSGDSAYSNSANATTLPNAPSAPSGLTATAVSSSQINLAWTDTSSNEDGFKIERKTGSAGTYAQIGTVGAGVTAYNDTGLSPSTTYYYQVRAYNTGGNSAYSNEAHDTTQAAPGSWTAYDDCVYKSGYDTNVTNTTHYGPKGTADWSGSDYSPTTGLLVKNADGSSTGVTVTFGFFDATPPNPP